MTVTFFDAGHILGSEMILLEAGGRRLGFTGDLGRPGTAIIRDPEALPAVDLLLIESTYGNRDHSSHEDAVAHLGSVITETVQRGGRVLIPAFAVGRTQEIIVAMQQQRAAGKIPEVPVYVDSPMATDATEIFRRHAECFDEETRARLRTSDPFGLEGLKYVQGVEESRALIAADDPCVVIATSGMVEGGRIREHLTRFIGDPRSTILFVGYQAENTLGRRLLDGVPEVRIYGEPYKVAIHIEQAEAFSAHADGNELLAWARHVPKIGRAFCIHGDEPAAAAMARLLSDSAVPASVPVVGQCETV
jgi:metallo-beta-lactamase family protein